MPIHFSGLSGCKLLSGTDVDHGSIQAIDRFIPITFDGITDIEIGWDYLLLWVNGNLYISGKMTIEKNHFTRRLLQIPDQKHLRFKQAIAGSENVTILTESNEIWLFNIYKDIWTKIENFITDDGLDTEERVEKIYQGRCTFALSNHGRVFSIPVLVTTEKPAKFIDVACGYDHTILLTDNGEVYSMGLGTRGQLGHCDLEDCDEPKLIEALAGLKVVQIAAGGWHSAAITKEGDLYTWGWNYDGQLGIPEHENVLPIPTFVEFKNQMNITLNVTVKKVQCGSAFTMVLIDNSELWGCGSNKYGQLGRCRKADQTFKQLTQLFIDTKSLPIKDIKCREWSSCIYS